MWQTMLGLATAVGLTLAAAFLTATESEPRPLAGAKASHPPLLVRPGG